MLKEELMYAMNIGDVAKAEKLRRKMKKPGIKVVQWILRFQTFVDILNTDSISIIYGFPSSLVNFYRQRMQPSSSSTICPIIAKRTENVGYLCHSVLQSKGASNPPAHANKTGPMTVARKNASKSLLNLLSTTTRR